MIFYYYFSFTSIVFVLEVCPFIIIAFVLKYLERSFSNSLLALFSLAGFLRKTF